MQGLFNMTTDSHLFRTREQLEAEGWALEGNVFHRNGQQMLPLYEAKMIHQFDHRWATYERDGSSRNVTAAEKMDHAFAPMPRYWVTDSSVHERLTHWKLPTWLHGFRNVARSTDERTAISTLLPRAGVGHSMPLLNSMDPIALAAILGSFAWDYVTRQKVAGVNFTLNYFMQIAAPCPSDLELPANWASGSTISTWLGARTRELLDVDDEMNVALSSDLTPYQWDVARRAKLRAELDGALFHMYGLLRDEVQYIMETFAIVKSKDIAAQGEYRTKRLILEVYDAMQHAIDTGTEYQTILDPPPGHGPRHPAKEH